MERFVLWSGSFYGAVRFMERFVLWSGSFYGVARFMEWLVLWSGVLRRGSDQRGSFTNLSNRLNAGRS
jgi:hypothetical protein